MHLLISVALALLGIGWAVRARCHSAPRILALCKLLEGDMLNLFRLVLWTWLATMSVTARADILVEFDSGTMTVERNDLGFSATPRVTATFRFVGDTLPERFNLGKDSSRLLLGYTISDGSHSITRIRSTETMTLAVDYYPATSRRSERVIGSAGLLVVPPGSGLDGLQIGMSQDGDALVQAWTDSETKTAAKMFRATSKYGSWIVRRVAGWDVPKKLYFAIAYMAEEKDCAPPPGQPCFYFQAFVDAARTWETETRSSSRFRQDHDILILANVRTVDDFIRAWNHIDSEARRQNALVVEGSLFTHASYPLPNPPPSTGLEFKPSPETSRNALTRDLINDLPVLPWDRTEGRLALLGCNTAEMRDLFLVPWSPAKVFADRQRVQTSGEVGWSSFSRSKAHLVRISREPGPVYLGAYYWTYNVPWPPTLVGLKMPPRVFQPD